MIRHQVEAVQRRVTATSTRRDFGVSCFIIIDFEASGRLILDTTLLPGSHHDRHVELLFSYICRCTHSSLTAEPPVKVLKQRDRLRSFTVSRLV